MRYPALLQLARGVTESVSNSCDPSGSLVYKIFGCVQSRDVNLEATPQPGMHRFAVMNADAVDDDVLQLLDEARALGALSPVKLIDVREASLYLFLDAKVSSSTFTAIESLWLSFLGVDANLRWAVRFASESEIFTGRSDYDFWPAARKILESEALWITHPLPEYDNPFTENYGYCDSALGQRGVKTIEQNLRAFEKFFNFSESHDPQMIGRCLAESKPYPIGPNRWPHAECAKCGNAIVTMPSKPKGTEANIPS